jgi:uncharacterized membrane protein YccF (DUF307 family)
VNWRSERPRESEERREDDVSNRAYRTDRFLPLGRVHPENDRPFYIRDDNAGLDDTGIPPGSLTRLMTQRSLLVRALWFVFVGWWVTPIVVNTAWLLNVTVVLLPIGIKLINLVPTVLTLAEPRSLSEPESARGQRSLAVRAIYFVLVGWWLSLLWANVASFLAITVVGLPIAIWMLNRLPYVTSLYRFHG